MRRHAVNPSSVLPRLVDAFSVVEQDPTGPGTMWTLAERINRATRSLGPELRHLVAAEGNYVGFKTCKNKHGLLSHNGTVWVFREGNGRPRKGDLEDALTFLTTAIECAVAGQASSPAESLFDELYLSAEPTAEPGEMQFPTGVLLNLSTIGPAEIYLEYIFTPPEARGTGAGSKALGLLTSLADRFCVTIGLKAHSFRINNPYSRELDKEPGENFVPVEALVKLYQRFGWRGTARYMERVPVCSMQKAARFRAVGSWRDLLDQNDGFVYHVTCGPWDSGDLESLQDRILDYEERLEFIREKWPESDSNYTPEEYDFSEADTIHCNWTLEEAEEWRDIYCPDGQILEIAWHWCDLRVERGREQDGHPVIRGSIPAKCIKVIE